MSPRPMDNEGMHLLCASIVRQAVIDYWNDCEPCIRKTRKQTLSQCSAKIYNYKESNRVSRKEEEERFFLGNWFRALLPDSSITGRMMLKHIALLRSEGRKIVFYGINGEEEYVQ